MGMRSLQKILSLSFFGIEGVFLIEFPLCDSYYY